MRTGAAKQFKKKQLNYRRLSDKDVNKGAFIAAISKSSIRILPNEAIK